MSFSSGSSSTNSRGDFPLLTGKCDARQVGRPGLARYEGQLVGLRSAHRALGLEKQQLATDLTASKRQVRHRSGAGRSAGLAFSALAPLLLM